MSICINLFFSFFKISFPDLLISNVIIPHATAPEKAENQFTAQAGFGWPWKVTK